MNFEQALAALKNGEKLSRDGWNGKGMFVMVQTPDEHSKMTKPYFYITVTGDSETRVPWVPSVTDLMAEDWTVVE
jgi:hypothetical protein